MKNAIKISIMFIVLAAALSLIISSAMAQWSRGMLNFPLFTQQPLNVPTQTLQGDIVIDNFEYWDSPYNHGWRQKEPPYPTYGFGIGYAAIFNTILDLLEGSRVLDVYRPPSVFLLGPGSSGTYAQHGIIYPGGGCLDLPIDDTPILSFKFRAPIGIEPWDIFRLTVLLSNESGVPCGIITIVPTQSPSQTCADKSVCPYPFVDDEAGNVTVYIGRGFLDGSWHSVWIDVKKLAANTSLTDCVNYCNFEASGQMFRLDDIILRVAEELLCGPYLFKIGPRFAQIFEPYRYLFFADYRDKCIGPSLLNVTDLLLVDKNGLMPGEMGYSMPVFPSGGLEMDPNVIKAYWIDQGVDPNAFDPNRPESQEPFESISEVVGYPWFPNTLPIFKDPNWRLNMNADPGEEIKNPAYHSLASNQAFLWNGTVGGIGASGVQFLRIQPLPINPFDGMPTYVPVYGPMKILATVNAYGKPFFGPNVVPAFEAALYNAGFSHWPGIAYLDFTPFVFEDIILSIEVSNGRTSDMETFPISVVNYPVENYPPQIEDVDNWMFMTGKTGSYALSVIDPDCTIFSMSPSPATTHTPMTFGTFREDMSGIKWGLTQQHNSVIAYQYGPWIESILDPCTGLISLTPKFEGHIHLNVVATDPLGASAITMFMINVHTQGTWLNHPPHIMMDWEHPQIMNAGEELILTEPDLRVMDPDGDELYFSCNIGSCGRTASGKLMWTFTTNFPGNYRAEIVFYDIRGGYSVLTIDIIVKPWWSY